MPTLTKQKSKPTRQQVKMAKMRSVFKRLSAFDDAFRKDLDKDIVLVGVDEVGRGSLIGPVVAGAACLMRELDKKEKKALVAINDSKQLTWEQREELYELLRNHDAIKVAVGEASKDEVDKMNIHYASLLASYRAFTNLCEQISYAHENTFLLLDGRAYIPDLCRTRQKAVVRGDGHSLLIASASIVAKQYRDHMMILLSKEYPGYGWETNMGYNTAEHQEGIDKLGLTPLHRLNYKACQEQLSLELSS